MPQQVSVPLIFLFIHKPSYQISIRLNQFHTFLCLRLMSCDMVGHHTNISLRPEGWVFSISSGVFRAISVALLPLVRVVRDLVSSNRNVIQFLLLLGCQFSDDFLLGLESVHTFNREGDICFHACDGPGPWFLTFKHHSLTYSSITHCLNYLLRCLRG